MNKFFIYTARILILSSILAVVLQKIADQGLKKSDLKIFTHWKEVLDGEINSDLIILGSSRGVVSYDPEIFSKNTGLSSFNLSFNAGSYNLQDLKFEVYLEKNVFPKVIIQNVDLTHFSKSTVIPNKYQFIPFMDKEELTGKLSSVEESFSQFSYIPLFKYNQNVEFLYTGLINFTRTSPRANTAQGFSPVSKNFQIDLHNLNRLRNNQEDPEVMLQYLEGLNTLEKKLKRNVPSSTMVFLVWAPEHSDRLFYARSIRKEVEKHLKELDQKFVNVYFLNYSSDPISKDSSLFYDTFHLNKKGAVIFSEKVSRDILELSI